MFAVEGGPRPYKRSNKSFLFGGPIRRNNPQTSQQTAFSTDSTVDKFGVEGRSRNGGMAFDLQFYFVDTCGVPEGSMPRQAILDVRPRKRNNPISDIYRASDTFMARV
jgi:hypothetical protein